MVVSTPLRPRLLALAGALIAVLFGMMLAASIRSAPVAHGAGLGPIIHWDSTMIYPGENNGYPWGPVGERAMVHGAQFVDSAVLGQPVSLALLPGDVNHSSGGSPYEFCKLAVPKIAIGQVGVDSSGNFDYSFTWPAAAGSGRYSICAYNTVDGLPAGNTDDGPFDVLSSTPPRIAISRSSVGVGQSITVTGNHWTPPQAVNVYIAACADCGGPVVVTGTAHSSGLNTGTFSITFTIPANAAPGTYVAGAIAHSVLDVGPAGAKSVTIVGAAPTATPPPTATAAATPTSSAAGGGAGGGGNGIGGTAGGLGSATPLVLVLAGAGVLLLLLVVVLVILLLARRGKSNPSPGVAGASPQGWGLPPMPGGNDSADGGDVYSAGGTVQQNWQVLPSGWGSPTPPTVIEGTPAGMPQGDDAPTQAGMSQFIDPSMYPPAPPARFPAESGDTPTQPGS
jgi:hypothetical protein